MEEAPKSPVKSVEWQDRTAIVRLAGEVDVEATAELQRQFQALVQERPRRVVVDLSGVTFMDSSGVASLVKLLSASRRGPFELRLAGMDDRVRGIFEVTRLTTLFDIRRTVQEALS